jgi:transcription elongation factor Elf1
VDRATGPDEGILTCPACGHHQREAMPRNACVRFYVCGACGARHGTRPGNCCVFCSWGDRPCPPRREGT